MEGVIRTGFAGQISLGEKGGGEWDEKEKLEVKSNLAVKVCSLDVRWGYKGATDANPRKRLKCGGTAEIEPKVGRVERLGWRGYKPVPR